MSKNISITLQKPEAVAIIEAIPTDELDATLEDYILIADRILRSVRVSERDALSEIFGRLDGFEQTFRQVLGAVNKSQKRGVIGEAEVLLDLNLAYGPADKFVSVSKTGHAGDIVGTLKAGERILIEVKNYTDSVPTPEVEKFWRDMRENNYAYGIFISLQTPIRGMPTENFAYRQEGPRRAVFVVNSAFDNIGHRMALEYIRRLIELEQLSAVSVTNAELAPKIATITDQMNIIRDSLNLAADIRKTAQDTTQMVQLNMAQVTERILELQVRIRTGLENIDRVLQSLGGYRLETPDATLEANWLTIIDILPEDYKLAESVRTICAGLAGYGLTFQPGENGLHQILHQDQTIGCLEVASNRVTLLTNLDTTTTSSCGSWKSAGKSGSYQWKWDFKSAKEARENIPTIATSLVMLKK